MMRGAATLAAAVILLSAAAPAKPPKARDIVYLVDGARQTGRPLVRALDPVHTVRALTRNHREAANVDDADQVRLPSTWWTPRVGFRAVRPEDIDNGLGVEGPAPPPWTIIKTKSKGVSPGFQIKDTRGVTWALKLDPPREPELASAADVIGSRLMWAAGYNVPENVIVTFRREDLTIKKGLTASDPMRGDRPFGAVELDTLLAHGARMPDGRWRAIASRFLEGKPLGEFRFDGRRKDDPEDMIPHNFRRELRGLWTVAAWINHDDCSARNTLDMWVTENHRSFVRHHLIDFSGTLGSASIYRHPYRTGTEYAMDFGVLARNVATLGLVRGRWEHAVDPGIPGVGFIDAATFDPVGWRPLIANPAFDLRTERDIRWGARIVAAFDEPLIRAAVRLGKLSDPRAEDALVSVLLARRDLIARRWRVEPTAIAADSAAARQ